MSCNGCSVCLHFFVRVWLRVIFQATGILTVWQWTEASASLRAWLIEPRGDSSLFLGPVIHSQPEFLKLWVTQPITGPRKNTRISAGLDFSVFIKTRPNNRLMVKICVVLANEANGLLQDTRWILPIHSLWTHTCTVTWNQTTSGTLRFYRTSAPWGPHGGAR